MAVYVNDSGTWRPVTVYVNDSGTWRQSASYLNDSGTWRNVGYATWSATMTQGSNTDGATFEDRGFINGVFGSLDNASDSHGHTITKLADSDTIPPSITVSELAISGFSSDPGQGYFESVTAHGTTKTSASATYGYSSGSASWTWGSGFGFATSGTTPASFP